jgi:hypothetical protein
MRRAFAVQMLRIAIGYVGAGLLAAVAASATLWLLRPVAHYLFSEGPLWGLIVKPAGILSSFAFATEIVFLLCLPPSAVLIVISEWRELRSRNWFMLAGAMASLVTLLTLTFLVYDVGPQIWQGAFKPDRFLIAALATFFVGLPSAIAAGVVYWVIAGRFSGSWRDMAANTSFNAVSGS